MPGVPSVAPVSVKTGEMSPADLEKKVCSDLKKLNKDARADFIGKTKSAQAKTDARRKAKREQAKKDNKPEPKFAKTPHEMASNEGMTFSSVHCDMPGIEGRQFTAASNAAVFNALKPRLVSGSKSRKVNEGLPQDVRRSKDPAHKDAKEAAGLLCDKTYAHVKGGFGSHGEGKLMGHVTDLMTPAKMKGGSLVFNVDWIGKFGPSGMPCEAFCNEMFRHAVDICKIRIFLCNEDDEQVEFTTTGDPNTAYSELCKKVDKSDTPGRPATGGKRAPSADGSEPSSTPDPSTSGPDRTLVIRPKKKLRAPTPPDAMPGAGN